MSMALLALIVFLAFGIEAAMGFGCNVLAVTFAAHLYPLERLLPVLVSLNLVVSTYIVLRHRRAIDWSVLLRRVLPMMALGMPLGMAAFSLAAGTQLKLGFGLFVVLIATVELWRVTRPVQLAARPLGPVRGAGVLLGAGVTHGLYASGGPLAVYFSSRELRHKGQFRSTLSALWLLLNLVLLAGYIINGQARLETATTCALLLPPLGAGIVAGEWLHGRVNEQTFRILVFLLLLAGGVTLALASSGGNG